MTKCLLYRIWYKKTLKKTGKPLMIQDVATGNIVNVKKFDMKNCDISISFNNAIGEAKACGATTVLEIYKDIEWYI